MNNKRPVQYILAAIFFMVIGAFSVIVLSVSLSSMSVSYSELKNGDEEIITRISSCTGSSIAADEIKSMVGSGIYSIGDYAIRSFTSADYLCKDVDDETFARDFAVALLGESDSDMEAVILSDLQSHSRMYAMNNQLKALRRDYAATGDIDSDMGDSFSNCSVMRSLGGVDGYTIGIRRVEGTFESTGDELRTDFFVDGTLYQGSIQVQDTEENNKSFVMAWNTAGVDAGQHNVVILMRSSDGRGQLIDGGSINVPLCNPLSEDSVQAGTLGNECTWYIYTAEDKDAYVNFVGLSDDIKVTIYDAYGNAIGVNDVPGDLYEVARGRRQDTDEISAITGISGVTNTYYLKAERGAEADPDSSIVVYNIVTSKEVARYNGSFMAVLSDVGNVPEPNPMVGYTSHPDTITLRDGNGNDIEANYSSVSFAPINGTLTGLSLDFVGSEDSMNYFPSYSMVEENYGYYMNNSSSAVVIHAQAQEGYAAQVILTVENSDGVRSISPEEEVNLADGENIIRATVNSFTGYTKVYSVYILNGDDNGDFAENTLSKFPDSYKAGLWMLHCIHPNYNFRAYNTGLDFAAVLDNEDNESRSLANINSHPNWVKPDSPVYDGGGWMAATNPVVQYFLDPRNFLEPVHIFQFEMLSFDSNAQTMDGINNILDGSFMDTNDPNYAQIIYEAGQTANVSPYFLASRIIQEMGYSGVSPLCHGTLPGYEGYYNFFDIGATPDPDIENGAQINGARYAMWGARPDEQEITDEERELLLPWNSVDRAITGGALWIASRYTSAGQDTLYFQKFDVIDNDDGLYMHQYAQNISMAYSEGARYFNGYASINMLDESFTFLIPVYNHMPAEFGVMPPA